MDLTKIIKETLSFEELAKSADFMLIIFMNQILCFVGVGGIFILGLIAGFDNYINSALIFFIFFGFFLSYVLLKTIKVRALNN